MKKFKYKNKNKIPKSGVGPEKTVRFKNKHNVYNNHVGHMLKWLVVNYNGPAGFHDPCIRFASFIGHVSKYKGVETAIKLIKEIRLCFTRFLAGNPILKSINVNSDGFPKRLFAFREHLENVTAVKLIMSLLTFLRSCTLPLNPDIDAITHPYKGSDLSELKGYISGFTKMLSRLPNKPKGLFRNNRIKFRDWKSYHLTTKSGPNGQALFSCLDDLEIIPESLRESIACLGGSDLKERMTLVHSNLDFLRERMKQPRSKKDLRFRKLSPIHGPEGKTRVVAIGDY